MGGAESPARVDLDDKSMARRPASIVAAMHQETPGRNRPPFPLRQGHPIGGGDFLDSERAGEIAGGGLCDQCQQVLARWPRLKVSEDLKPLVAAIEQPHRGWRWVARLFEGARDALRGPSPDYDAGLMNRE